LRLDVYRQSEQKSPRPLVVYIHGGGWQSGHTRQSGAFENFPGVLASLAARGYVVASVEYRLSGEARFPAAIQDVKSAILWLRKHATDFGIDPSRAVVWGGSAGGQLAALAGVSCGVAALAPLGMDDDQKASSAKADCVQGIVAWYGVFDFATIGRSQGGNGASSFEATSAPGKYFGCTASGCDKQIVRSASPVNFVDAGDPPTLLIHGERDRIVPIEQSRSFDKALKAKGVKVELVEIPDVDHSFVGATQEATRKASLEALDKTFEFIDRTIGQDNKR
jgi:acetyl esterase/lipase